jgi:polygalacturonase
MHPFPFYPRVFASAIIVLCIGIASCGSEEPTSITIPEVSEPSSSLDLAIVKVTDFGARGNDLRDDTEAFAAALNAIPETGGTVRIPAGTYLLTATPRSSIGRGIDVFRRSNITLEGAGMQKTILRMAPGAYYKGDTSVVLIELSSGITLRDLTLDGNRTQVTYIDQQSHGVNVRGSSNVRFERVVLTGMHGDGILLIGNVSSNAWAEQVHVEDCLFSHNGRSGIAVQRAVRNVTITGSTFTRIQDQAIDMEPSDAVTANNIAPHDFRIANNRFYDTATLALTITGISSGKPARNVLVTNNDFDGAGIFVFNAVDIQIEGNEIRSGGTWAPIEIRKRSHRILIKDNFIDSRRTARSAAIALTFHTSEAPRDVSVINNTIQTAEYGAYFARDAEGLKIMGNTIYGHGTSGINIQDVNPDSPLRDFLVENNAINGYQVGVRFVSREDPMRDVCVRDNIIIDVSDELQMKGPVRRGCD